MSELQGPSIIPEQPVLNLLLLHGFGSDGDDLISLAEAIEQHLPEHLQGHVAYFAPNGPAPTRFGFGYQWFADKDYTFKDRDGIDQAKDLLENYLQEINQKTGLTNQQTYIVGFSQGTMTALYAAPRLKQAVAGVVGFSGRMLWADELEGEKYHHSPTMLVHGEEDDVVPVSDMEEAAQKLAMLNIPVTHHAITGLGHGIDAQGIELLVKFIANK